MPFAATIAAPKSTVHLRAAPLPGPAPAENTSASAAPIACANTPGPSCSRSQTTGSALAARTSAS
jgi:hypothetical protein